MSQEHIKESSSKTCCENTNHSSKFNFVNKNIILDENLENEKDINITINGKQVKVPAGITVIQACEMFNVEIPRFCYHDKLKIAGNCRMCLVEIQPGPPKPQASCAMNVAEGMVVKTDTEMVKKAREGVMEFLLANHPLDCPVCDQGGECDLQDQAFIYGNGKSRVDFERRVVKDKNMGPLIKTNMTRCIHCTRCVRFMEDVAGTSEIGAFNRGNETEISTYLETAISSEMSGNIIDLCPVGALTSKPFAYKARSWELVKTYSIDTMDAVGSNIRIDSKGNEVLRILPKINNEINEEWISDKTRFSYDGLFVQRLDKAYLKQYGKMQAVKFSECIDYIANQFSLLKNPSKDFAILLGDAVDSYTSYLITKVAEKLNFKVACVQDNAKINASSRPNYLFNSKIANVDNADLFLIINSNPRKEAPVINSRIRKAVINNKAKVFVLGDNLSEDTLDLNYKYTYLGNKKSILNDIKNGSHEMCQLIQNAKMPMLILGQDAVNTADGYDVHNISMEIADKYFHRAEKNHNGFNMLHKVAGRVGAIDSGANITSYHEIVNAVKQGEIKMLGLFSVDEAKLDTTSQTFVFYVGSHGDNGVKYSNAIVPATSFVEKNAFYTNTEGVLQQARKSIANIGDAIDDEKIVKLLFAKFNIDIDFAELSQEVFLNWYCKKINETQKQKLQYSKVDSQLNGNFVLNKKSFYQTCPISRASKTMALCVEQIEKNYNNKE